MRLIDADVLIEEIGKEIDEAKKAPLCDYCAGMKTVIGIVKNQDSVDPVKHGHWVQMGPPNKNSETLYRCSICDYLEVVPLYDTHNYCGGCGARMDGDSK